MNESIHGLNDELKKWQALVNETLAKLIKGWSLETPSTLKAAMEYALEGKAKRLRPILCLWTYELFSSPPTPKEIIEVSCALEILHTYTLVHDDLPSMDNDDYRRGKLALHKAYDEATAILAGDALLTYSFELISSIPSLSWETRCKVIQDFASLTGAQGVIGGQIMDLNLEQTSPSPEEIEGMYYNKTAKLLIASLRMGCFLAEKEEYLPFLTTYGACLGLAFQLSDDLLDLSGDLEQTGKLPGSDQKTNKAAFPLIYGKEKTKDIIREKVREGKEALASVPGDKDKLLWLADYMIYREQ